MMLPMMGSRTATILDVGAVSIHGQVNVQMKFHMDGDPDTLVMQGAVAREAAPPGLKAGDRVQLEFLMGNVVRVSLA